MSESFDPAHLVGGSYLPAEPELEIRRPSDKAPVTGCPVAGPDLVDQAVETAKRAWTESGWGSVQPRERVRVLHAWADLIDAQAQARLEAVPSTRPVRHRSCEHDPQGSACDGTLSVCPVTGLAA